MQLDLLIYDTDQQGFLVNPYRGTRYPKEMIYPCSRLEFEGSLLSVPNSYHAYISQRYGNFMQLPPREKRFPHEGEADPFTPCVHPKSLVYGSG